MKNYLASATFIDEGNIFPYQYQENTCYGGIRISSLSYLFRMSDGHTKITLEYYDPKISDGERGQHMAVRYYSCSQKVGDELVKLMREI